MKWKKNQIKKNMYEWLFIFPLLYSKGKSESIDTDLSEKFPAMKERTKKKTSNVKLFRVFTVDINTLYLN